MSVDIEALKANFQAACTNSHAHGCEHTAQVTINGQAFTVPAKPNGEPIKWIKDLDENE
ncbi:hypothetical protein KAR91_82435 [Candidatus Pacearchaeota archaeon]|nr:hypothetical protein [Candidatus Pacearchaeota archaeon]